MLTTAFGIVAATTMVVAYALEARGPRWIAVFAVGCAATALYGIVTGAWIFAVLETIWAAIAGRRYLANTRRGNTDRATPDRTAPGFGSS